MRKPDDIVCQAPEPKPKGSEPEYKGGCQSQSQTVVAEGERQDLVETRRTRLKDDRDSQCPERQLGGRRKPRGRSLSLRQEGEALARERQEGEALARERQEGEA